MTRHPPTYRAYLLRIWTRAGDGDVRASIRDVESGETHAFTDLHRLAEWLRGEVRAPATRTPPTIGPDARTTNAPSLRGA